MDSYRDANCYRQKLPFIANRTNWRDNDNRARRANIQHRRLRLIKG